MFFAVYLSQERYDRYIAGSEWTFVWAGSIITLQSLTWLTTKWNVNLDSLFTSTSVAEVSNARLIKVIPVTNAGSAEICPLIRDHVRTAMCSFKSVTNKLSRKLIRRMSRFSSRNGDFSMIRSKTVLHRCRMTSTKNQDRLSELFNYPRA